MNCENEVLLAPDNYESRIWEPGIERVSFRQLHGDQVILDTQFQIRNRKSTH